MLIETLRIIFKRDLTQLRVEIDLYPNEEKIWVIEHGIANSAGNLCLHLIGNLNYFIGEEIGKSGYVRNRPLEFSLKDIPKAKLIEQIDATIGVVDGALSTLKPKDLAKEYPILVFKEKTTTEYFLVHLATHLSYHLGQVNYHRRLLAKSSEL